MRDAHPRHPRVPGIRGIPGFLGRTAEYWISVGFVYLIVSGFFSGDTSHPLNQALASLLGESSLWIGQIGLLIVPLLVGISRILRRPWRAGDGPVFLGLSLMMIVSANAAIDIPRGWHTDLFPVNYLFLSLLAVVLGLGEAVFLAAWPAGIEALSFLARGTIDTGYPVVLSHAALSLLFVLSVGTILLRERRHRERVEARDLDREREVRALAPQPVGAAPQADLKVLSKKSRDLRAARAADSLEDKIHGILMNIDTTVHPYTCVLYMQDDDDGVLRVKDIVSISDHVTNEVELRPGEGLVGWVAKERKPLFTSEVDKIITGLPYYTREEAIRSFLAVPIIRAREGTIAGVLSVDSLQTQAFTEEHGKILEFASSQILNTNEYERMRHQKEFEAQQYEAFNNFSNKITSTLDLEQVLTNVVDSSMEIIPADLILFALFNPDTKTYTVRSVRGEVPGRLPLGISKGGDDWVGREFPRESLIGRAVEEYRKKEGVKENFIFDNLKGRDRGYPIIGDGIAVDGMDSCLIAPFLARGEVLGALVLFSRKRGVFAEHDAKIIGNLANQAALSIYNARLHRQVEEMATTDGLTGLLNHRSFQERLGEEMKRVARHPSPVSLLLADIDFFKKINDQYGHPVGDMVLKTVARVLCGSIREIDLASRYGGEEFALILKNTDRKGALKMGERIRKAVSEEPFRTGSGETFTVTLSVGAASCPDDARGKQELIDKADGALYLAKRRGRNRVETYTESPEEDEATQVKERNRFTF